MIANDWMLASEGVGFDFVLRDFLILLDLNTDEAIVNRVVIDHVFLSVSNHHGADHIMNDILADVIV